MHAARAGAGRRRKRALARVAHGARARLRVRAWARASGARRARAQRMARAWERARRAARVARARSGRAARAHTPAARRRTVDRKVHPAECTNFRAHFQFRPNGRLQLRGARPEQAEISWRRALGTSAQLCAHAIVCHARRNSRPRRHGTTPRSNSSPTRAADLVGFRGGLQGVEYGDLGDYGGD